MSGKNSGIFVKYKVFLNSLTFYKRFRSFMNTKIHRYICYVKDNSGIETNITWQACSGGFCFIC